MFQTNHQKSLNIAIQILIQTRINRVSELTDLQLRPIIQINLGYPQHPFNRPKIKATNKPKGYPKSYPFVRKMEVSLHKSSYSKRSARLFTFEEKTLIEKVYLIQLLINSLIKLKSTIR